jgi:SagB-type dehydrogenase family enzyme
VIPRQIIFYKSILLFIASVLVVSIIGITEAKELKTIKLNEPNMKRGLPFMETLSIKASVLDWSDKELNLQDLSDLMWAANGLNRPQEKKYTASSAQNAHDVNIYVFMKDGVYIYDAEKHALNPVLNGDYRSQLLSPPPLSNPPIQLILISDSSSFIMGSDDLKYELGAIDTGIVSQNISLFCAATGIKTRPRSSMDKEKIKKLLKLKDTQHVFLNHPIGYSK